MKEFDEEMVRCDWGKFVVGWCGIVVVVLIWWKVNFFGLKKL